MAQHTSIDMDKKRITVALSPNLDQALELHCAIVRRTKNDIVTEALKGFLRNRHEEAINLLQATVAAISQ